MTNVSKQLCLFITIISSSSSSSAAAAAAILFFFFFGEKGQKREIPYFIHYQLST